MEYVKPWRSIDEQIDAFVAKGMTCCRDDLAKKLREVGYYRLSAYWYPYKVRNEAGESFFRPGTTFDNV